MSNETLVRAWKDPMYRTSVAGQVNHPAGDAFAELTEVEMNAVAGAGDVEAMASSGSICTITGECPNCSWTCFFPCF
ncbi:plantaricin C family lantibiotic [Priestia megaterium]|uniref:plantaricin C family lantibiotic n=1 Tax=Priestia megaterium TaxID=1404 RepID=UPI0036713455